MDEIIILRCDESFTAAKRFERNNKGKLTATGVRIGRYFKVKKRTLSNLDDLCEILGELENEKRKFAIRGEPVNADLGEKVRRLSRSTSEYPARFRATARRWCMIDIDGVDLPHALPPAQESIDAALTCAIGHLPDDFHNVDCWYQFSASMGIKPGIRVHLWYWLDRPVSDEEMKVWLTDSSADLSLFQAIQIHFTVKPEFPDDADDPFPERSGLHRAGMGIETVGVPEISRPRSNQQGQRQRGRSQYFADYDQQILRDLDTGLVVDGRERFLLLCSNRAMTEALRERGKRPTVEDVANLTWRMFSEAIDNTDGRWSSDHAVEEARRRIIELETGRWTFAGRNEETILYPTDAPYYSPELVGREEGLAKLESHLSTFFRPDDQPKRIALRMTMGAGKTHRTISHLKEFLADRFNQRIEIYVPYHDLANDYERELLKNDRVNARVVHVYPRTGGRSGELPVMCGRADFVRSLEEAGLPVFKNACRSDEDKAGNVQRCPLYDTCGYIEQFADSTTGDWQGNVVRLFPHNHLSLPRNPVQSDPHIVIVDEAFSTGLAKSLKVSRASVSRFVSTDSFPRLGRTICEALEDRKPLFDLLREEGVTDAEFRLAENNIRSAMCKITFGVDFKLKNDDISRRDTLTALRLLREEYAISERKNIERLTYDPMTNSVICCIGSEVKIPDDAHLLILDATADELLLESAVGFINYHRIDIEQRAYVTQVYDRTGSKAFWRANPDEVRKLVRVVNAWAEFGEKPLVIGNKALCDEIRTNSDLHPEVVVLHFGSLRGSNAAKECTVAFVTGRNQPPAAAVDEIARALFWAESNALFHDEAAQLNRSDDISSRTGFLPLALRGYLNAEDGPEAQHGVMVHAFTDPRIEAIHAQLREAESVQAIARLRLVHAKRMKRVFLLSNLPLEIPVHRLCKFDELMPDPLEVALLKKGNVPLTPLGLTRMRPDLALSYEVAKKRLQRSVLGREEQLRMLPALLGTACVVVTFRAHSKGRMKKHKHLFLMGGDDVRSDIPLLQGRTGRIPFTEWVRFLNEGDPAIPDTGWGEVVEPTLDWFPVKPSAG